MAKYTKNQGISGAWLKGKDVTDGAQAKLVSETIPQASQFQNKDGSAKQQNVAKIRVKGKNETLNISLNRATINALIDAYGEDSKDWIDKVLTIHTEKVLVGEKRVTAVYLVPEGYVMEEDENGYMVISNSANIEVQTTAELVEAINPEDIPW